jgi:hypothetical protein
MMAVQGVVDDLLAAGYTKTDISDLIRAEFADVRGLPVSLPLTSRSRSRGYDVWTPESPRRVARHLVPALVAELGVDEVRSRLECLRDEKVIAGSSLPSVRAACNRVYNLSCTATLLQRIQEKVRELEPSKKRRDRLPVYEAIKEALEAWKKAAKDADKMTNALAAINSTTAFSGKSPPADVPNLKASASATFAAIMQNCATVENVESTLKNIEADLALMASSTSSEMTSLLNANLEDDKTAKYSDTYAPLAKYGGTRRRQYQEYSDAHVERLASGVLAGDVKILALLDAAGVDISQAEKAQVANAYVACTKGNCLHELHRTIKRRLGGRAAAAVRAAGLHL